MSWAGLCSECAERRFHENADDLYYHRGPNFRKWRRGMAASVGGLLIDDVLKNEE